MNLARNARVAQHDPVSGKVQVNAAPQCDPATQLRRYLAAVANRDPARMAECFAQRAVLELPAIKPSRFLGIEEIKTAHLLAFENLTEVALETDEVLATRRSAMTAGRLTVVCRGEQQIHAFGIAVECSESGLDRVSWYFDSRGYRSWSDKAVL
jgi:SnoaL-like domain